MLNLRGTYTALVTPFRDEHLNDEALIKNIHFQIENGVNGILVLGTTGETPTLSEAEQERILMVAVREVNGRIPILVGTGCNCTRTSIEKSRKAQDLGADGALIVLPYYNKPTQEGILLHFEKIASNISLPIIIYNIPGRTGVNLEIATLQKIAEIPQVIGIKECSGNFSLLSEIIYHIVQKRNNFAVLSGDDISTLPMIALGAVGVVSVVSNLLPAPIVDLVEAALNEDFERAKEIHFELLPFFKGAFLETNPTAIKELMNLAGMDVGICRLPLAPLKAENKLLLLELSLSRSGAAQFS